MVKMRALANWKGQEGRVMPGDILEVSEPRAKQLEGFETTSGRVLRPQSQDQQPDAREILRPPRAERVEAAKNTTKGGPTAGQRDGQHDKPEPAPEPNATNGARDLAAKHGATLAGISGTGKNGRIVRADVVAIYGEAPAE